MPDKDLAVSLMVHVSEYANINIDNKFHKEILHKLIVFGAWGQILLGFNAGFALFFFGYKWLKKKKRKLIVNFKSS